MNAHAAAFAPSIARSAAFCVLPLSRKRANVFCLLNPEDYEWAKEWVWNCGWFFDNKHRIYAKRNTGPQRLTVYLHRAIMQRRDPRDVEFMRTHVVDHINGFTLDNRWPENLRWATRATNNSNRRPRFDKAGNSISDIVRLRAELDPAFAASISAPF